MNNNLFSYPKTSPCPFETEITLAALFLLLRRPSPPGSFPKALAIFPTLRVSVRMSTLFLSLTCHKYRMWRPSFGLLVEEVLEFTNWWLSHCGRIGAMRPCRKGKRLLPVPQWLQNPGSVSPAAHPYKSGNVSDRGCWKNQGYNEKMCSLLCLRYSHWTNVLRVVLTVPGQEHLHWSDLTVALLWCNTDCQSPPCCSEPGSNERKVHIGTATHTTAPKADSLLSG